MNQTNTEVRAKGVKPSLFYLLSAVCFAGEIAVLIVLLAVKDDNFFVPGLILSIALAILTFALALTGLFLQKKKAKGQAPEIRVLDSEVLSNMGHDMRTPLNAIMGFSAMAKDEKEPTRIRSYLDKITASGELFSALIDDTSTISKLRNDEVKLENKPILLHNELSAVIASLTSEADRKHVDVTYDEKQLTSDALVSDAIIWRHILLNLGNNAIRSSPELGRIFITLSSTSHGNNKVTVSCLIRDPGKALPPRLARKDFRPLCPNRFLKPT
jgi:signal transduction histidine kinase